MVRELKGEADGDIEQRRRTMKRYGHEKQWKNLLCPSKLEGDKTCCPAQNLRGTPGTVSSSVQQA